MPPPTPTYFQTMTPIPPLPSASKLPSNDRSTSDLDLSPTTTTPTHPTPKPHRTPRLRLQLHDISHLGSQIFLTHSSLPTLLSTSVSTVLSHLYTSFPAHCIPTTRSITLILRSMPGVAYTTGTDLDPEHKEIHVSTDYIAGINEERRFEEISGVVVHEMVHCWQHNAKGTAPGGLIEGIADWVRLKAGFAPPHWRRTAEGKWDAGYEVTGYFLEWLEGEGGFGVDVVRSINEAMRGCKYEEREFWEKCCGRKVGELWEQYRSSLEEKGRDGNGARSPAVSIPSCPPAVEVYKEEAHNDSEQRKDKSKNSAKPNDEHQITLVQHETPEQSEARVKARRGGNMHIPVRPGHQG
ncbi:BSP-domain-containing protein [Delitschia confertaspora ATCC 74209]|uniref:BSP-domain-containing protein n=1 Tax=Delitschia confertaspora ATCC 74209 TaxID=1513339 RepID=A0A9P4JYV7_9PLEO|nr:BSP-domain-containing protein [Delitschia confertaspora ATCC 74209]